MHANKQQNNPNYLLGNLDALRAQVKQINATIAALEVSIQPKLEAAVTPVAAASVPQRGYELFGQPMPARDLTEAFVDIFRHFAELEPTFPILFKNALTTELAKAKKPSKRGFIAATAQDLYPGKPKLWKYAKEIAPGWLLGTNESSEKKLKFIRIACEAIGLRWGKDLKLSFH